MQTDQLRKHLQLFTEGTAVPDDDLPGPVPAPAPSASTDLAARLRAAVPNEAGIKMIPLIPEEIAKYKDIIKRLDVLLKKYSKDGKIFEGVYFECMTESEQHQYIMQNLHLLSEADQMVVLRGIMNEDKVKMAGDIAKYGIEKIGIPAAKFAWNKVIEPTVKAGYNDILKPLVQNTGKFLGIATAGSILLGAIGGGSVYVYRHWNEIFPPSAAIDQVLNAEDKAEFDRLGDEYEAVLPNIPKGYKWAIPQDLENQLGEFEVRYLTFKKAAEQMARAPAAPEKTEPSLGDMAIDKLKGLMK